MIKELALQMIKYYRGKTKSDRWIDHCICVGDTAGKIKYIDLLKKLGEI